MCIPTVGAGTPELDMAWLHMIAARSQKCAYTRRKEYPVPVQYRTGTGAWCGRNPNNRDAAPARRFKAIFLDNGEQRKFHDGSGHGWYVERRKLPCFSNPSCKS